MKPNTSRQQTDEVRCWGGQVSYRCYVSPLGGPPKQAWVTEASAARRASSFALAPAFTLFVTQIFSAVIFATAR